MQPMYTLGDWNNKRLPIPNPRAILCKTTHRHWIHINVCRVSCGSVFNMLLVLSIPLYFHWNIGGCMCSTGPFQHRWLKGYIYSSCYHHQIGSIHLSHCCHIFRGCVPEMFVTSYSVTYCIYVPGKPGIHYQYFVQFMMSANSRTFWLADRTRLFLQYSMAL